MFLMNKNYYSIIPLWRIFKKICLNFTKRNIVVSREKLCTILYPRPLKACYDHFLFRFLHTSRKHLHMPLHINIQVKQYFWTEKPKSKTRVTNIFNDELDLMFPSFASFPPFKTYIYDGSNLKRSPSFPVSSIRSFPFENYLWLE